MKFEKASSLFGRLRGELPVPTDDETAESLGMPADHYEGSAEQADAEEATEPVKEPAREPIRTVDSQAEKDLRQAPESGIKAPPGKVSPQLAALVSADPGQQLRTIESEMTIVRHMLTEMRTLKGSAFTEKKAQFDTAFRKCKRSMDDYIKARFIALCLGKTSKEQMDMLAADRTYQKKKMVQGILEKLLTFDVNDIEEIYNEVRNINSLTTDI